jgi:N-acetylglutamate synthase-like GNAT family acetyltransferase
MQIRIGNTRDEAQVRDLLLGIMHEASLEMYFAMGRPPMTNMEQAYIGNDGTFMVAEEDQKIVGAVGALKKSEDILEFKFLAVHSDWRRTGLGKQLLDHVLSFAKQMEYKAVQVDREVCASEPSGFLLSSGFKCVEDEESEVWRITF